MRKIITISLILLVFIITSFLCLGYSVNISNKYDNLLTKQMIWNVVCIITMFILLFVNNKYIFKYSKIIYILNILLLIVPLLFSSKVNGVRAWIALGSFSFQPSELMKVSLAIMLASYLSKSKSKDYIKIIISFIITLIPSILVFLEPDTGSVIIYIFILLFMLFFNNINKKYFIYLFLVSIILVFGFIYLYKNNVDLIIKIFGTNIFYRVDRVINFTNKSNMQLNNALISIGSSSYYGHGINNNILYFPEAPTDFIFSLIVSLFGYLFGLAIVFLYFVLDLIIIKIIKKEKSNKQRLLLIGIFGAFLYQQIQNIFMNIGILPIVGITLPFLSYGGSSLLVYYIFIGLIFKSIKNNSYL